MFASAFRNRVSAVEVVKVQRDVMHEHFPTPVHAVKCLCLQSVGKRKDLRAFNNQIFAYWLDLGEEEASLQLWTIYLSFKVNNVSMKTCT